MTPIFRLFLPIVISAMCSNPDRVALMADMQNRDFATQEQVVRAVAARDYYEYLVVAGDVVHAAGCWGVHALDARWVEQMAVLAPLEGLEWHFAPGNHDYGYGYGDPHRYPARQDALDAWDRWVGPRYHFFESRHACFFLIDDMLWDDEQAIWLKGAVAACGKSWKILVKHRPLRNPWPEFAPAYTVEPNPSIWEQFGFDLVVAGHQHALAVWMQGRTLNITLPPVCANVPPPYPISGQPAITVVAVPMSGFAELEICSDALAWRVFREDGLLLLGGRLDN